MRCEFFSLFSISIETTPLRELLYIYNIFEVPPPLFLNIILYKTIPEKYNYYSIREQKKICKRIFLCIYDWTWTSDIRISLKTPKPC